MNTYVRIAILLFFALATTLRSGAQDFDAFPRVSLQHLHKERRELRSLAAPGGERRAFREGVLLVKFRGAPQVQAVLVPRGTELSQLASARQQRTVEFAQLDSVLSRQAVPNDPDVTNQWHHALIHSEQAWAVSFATHQVTVAIVDTPFQMNHPDLQANSVPGWSMVTQTVVTNDTVGFYHSTICAGLVGAVIDNLTGVAGVANCWLMPIDIGDEPTESDIHDAVVWAADHGVRVVNVSWGGAFSSVINEAGLYLKNKTRGMLFMPGVNGRRELDYDNQPDIYAISMTDRDDQPRSAFGRHIDFAAPGWEVYSTMTNSVYESDSGTSYSSPLVAGIVAWMMSVNPDLGPDEIEAILKASTVDLGTPGWDPDYGWGRIDFGRVARRTFDTLPVSRVAAQVTSGTVLVQAVPSAGATYQLFRSLKIEGPWEAIGPATSELSLRDTHPPPGSGFYKVEITLPR